MSDLSALLVCKVKPGGHLDAVGGGHETLRALFTIGIFLSQENYKRHTVVLNFKPQLLV